MTANGVHEAAREPQLAHAVTSRDVAASPDAAAKGRPRLGLTQLRWITIGVPVVVLAVLVHLMAFALPTVFQTPIGYVVTLALLVLAVAAFSHFVFAAVERLERRITQQNERLIELDAQRSSLLMELVDRNEELRILNDHSAALSQAAETTAVLDVVLRTLVEVSGSQSGEVWLSEAGALRLAHRIELDQPEHATAAGLTEPPPPSEDVSPVDHLPGSQRPATASFRFADGAARASLPLRSAGLITGLVRLVRVGRAGWSERQQRLLESIADQGGVAVSDARQRAHAREIAVLEERGRIAREMHDGLAQMLGYLNTKTYAIRRTLDAGDIDAATAMMADLEEAARDASVDVREGVLALRSTDANDEDLANCVSAYVQKFQRMSGISVELRLSPQCEDLQLSEMARLQVMRLIQEALSNVRKHSGAAKASVTMTAGQDALDVRIDDDGRGFAISPPDAPEASSFGLQTMRERAEAVGGRLTVSSQPGEGTHVNAIVPMLAPGAQLA